MKVKVVTVTWKDVPCKGCGPTKRKHHSKGYCTACYMKVRRKVWAKQKASLKN